MTGRSLLFATLALAVPAIAAAQVEQNVHGDVAHFGEGFTAISERQVDFRLLRPANVLLFWVTADGGIELFFPARSRDKTLRRAGGNAISVSEIPSPIQAPVINGAPVSGRAGQFAPAGSLLTGAPARDESDAVSGYWVLLTSDAPITALDVQKKLALMSREGGGLAVIDRLAPGLVPEGTLWAQYVAGGGVRWLVFPGRFGEGVGKTGHARVRLHGIPGGPLDAGQEMPAPPRPLDPLHQAAGGS